MSYAQLLTQALDALAGDGIDVTHHDTYCVAFREQDGWKVGYLSPYEDHGGDPAAAEAHARAKVAEKESWE